MTRIGLGSARSGIAHSMDDALRVQAELGFPAVIRPSFTLGGIGGGIAYNKDEFEEICKRGLAMSPTHELLIEESLLGWKEFEMEVVRDRKDNCIIVCSIENLDPMGVHTGDSITVAPAQTLTDKEYQIMRDASIAVLREVGVDTGGSNVQFAINPKDGRMIVIEMNPRVSRSSALASKATGFPIAKVAAKLAVGYTLDELANDITGGATPASFEPTIDYVVTKVPRFAFEKFKQADDRLTTQMKSVGEVMAIGRTFQESLQKALRGLEVGVDGFNLKSVDPEKIGDELAYPRAERLWYVADAFGIGMSLDELHGYTKIDPWFLAQIKEIVDLELAVEQRALADLTRDELRELKRKGFSDRRLAHLLKVREDEVRARRHALGVRPVYKRVDTCAAEFATRTAYMYSTYEEECEAEPTDRKKVMVLGGGPNRIGQGIEFDYCCVHAAMALREDGFETIMVNCNPETVSTDYDTSDRLYFEPLTLEDVLEIVHVEKPWGVIVQYGGQTPLKLARDLERNGVPIIGTTPDMIDMAEDRERFQQMLHRLELRQPPNRTARTEAEALAAAEAIGYPLVVRPSYVLGGRAMEIVHQPRRPRALHEGGREGQQRQPGAARPLPQRRHRGRRRRRLRRAGGRDRRHHGAHRAGRRALRRLRVLAAAVLAVARAAGRAAPPDGGDGAGPRRRRADERAVRDPGRRRLRARGEPARVAHRALRLQGDGPAAREDRGALHGGAVAAPRRASPARSLPPYYSVKEAVFPFIKFPGVDTILGPEMKSTGEVMGVGETFGEAFVKSQLAAGVRLPQQGKAFISLRNSDKPRAIETARMLHELGFTIVATRGTAAALEAAGVPVTAVNKVAEGRPHVVDMLKNDEIALVINTVEEKRSAIQDSYQIRRAALNDQIPTFTTMAGARAAVIGMKAMRELVPYSVQALHGRLGR